MARKVSKRQKPRKRVKRKIVCAPEWDFRETTPVSVALCRGQCERVQWVASVVDEDISKPERSDEDCRTPNQTEIVDIVTTALSSWARENSDSAPRGCEEGCYCDFANDAEWVTVRETVREFRIRWAEPVSIEGHLHFCRYSVVAQVKLEKQRVVGECMPEPGFIEPPEIIGPI